jgi:tetratricopeptide (TPR) repeat protein
MEGYMTHGSAGYYARSLGRITPLLLTVLAGCAAGDGAFAQDPNDVPLYDNLGTYHYEVATSEPRAQQYFDQGLRLYYGFNHAESIRAFTAATRLDEECALCWWGIALAYGPNINMPMDPASGAAAWDALQRAVALKEKAPAKERALIKALAARYAANPAEDRARLDSLYARAMEQVAEQYPQDPEANALYAEALMVLSPWEYWNRDESPRPDTPALLAALESVLTTHPDHPGANHFFIHAVEAVDPERALPMAERLAALMPGAGHIVHMPGHIYIRVGRYADAIAANEHAVHADEAYIRDHNPELGIYTLGYYPHNYDFLAFAASMIGRTEQAMQAADRMVELVPQEVLRMPGMTVLQNVASRYLQMRVRFGRWQEILDLPPQAADLPYARAIGHYARGRALAATGDPAGAAAELDGLRALASATELEDVRLEFNSARDVLAIAADVLAGHIAAARGDHNEAVARLRAAAAREDELVYGEPPEWSVPVRQELGSVLLDAGRPQDAERAFLEDLRRFPDNVWSLEGLARSLEAQGRTAEAAAARERAGSMRGSGDAAHHTSH